MMQVLPSSNSRDFPGVTSGGPVVHPLPGGIQPPGSAAHESALEADGALSRERLERLIRDIEGQPAWRTEADKCAAYYDNYQKTPEMERRAQELGQPVAVVNLISRSVNSMLGQEAKTRTSWQVKAEDAEHDDVADVTGIKLTEAQRETYADMAISEAYASQCKAGLGWVEVSRNPDPWADYKYRVENIHRNEIWWDWRDTSSLALKRARWLVRKRWLDLDDAIAEMPQFKDIFQRYSSTNGWTDFTFDSSLSMSQGMRQAYGDRTDFKINQADWYDNGRQRIMFYEVWYRVKVPAIALVVEDARTVEFDPSNTIHQMHLSTGTGKLVKAPKTILRMAIFAGPHRLLDVATKKTNFPYIPFWGFREDETKAPYGPVAGMLYPQDEYNARRTRLMALLQTVQAWVDSDALDPEFNTVEDLADNLKRADAVFITNPGRRNGQHAIDLRRDISLPAEQLEVMRDAQQLIQDQPGLTQPMVGSQNGMSGVAMSGLLEQGMTAMGDLNDNYRFARQAVGEALVDLILEDFGDKAKSYQVGVGANRRTVVINGWDMEKKAKTNDPSMASIKTSLSETPSTPAYKLAQQQQLMQVLQAAQGVPEAIQVILPDYIESTDLPNRAATAKLLREKWGLPDPTDRAATQAAQQQAQQAAQEQAAAAQQVAQAEAAHKNALAELDHSAAVVNMAKADHLKADIGLKGVQAQASLNEQSQNAEGAMTSKPGTGGQTPTEDDLIKQAMEDAGLFQ